MPKMLCLGDQLLTSPEGLGVELVDWLSVGRSASQSVITQCSVMFMFIHFLYSYVRLQIQIFLIANYWPAVTLKLRPTFYRRRRSLCNQIVLN
jgi:hypothetical protein